MSSISETTLPPLRTDLFTVDELQEKFGATQYIAVVVTLLISLGIGCYFWYRGKQNLEDFTMASRTMTTLPATLSIVATMFSSVAMLGLPVLGYLFGTQFILIIVGFGPAAWVAAKFYIPVFYELKLSTSLEYLKMRFGPIAHGIAVGVNLLMAPLQMAVGVYTPSLVLNYILGIDTLVAAATMFAVCVFYTSLGGLRAVMWTDTFQALVMLATFLAVTIKGVSDVGGATVVFDRNYMSGRIELFNFEFDPRVTRTFWSVLIGGFFYHTSFICTGPPLVQRYNSCVTLKTAISACKWTVPWAMAFISFPIITGLVAYAFYFDCDPLTTGQLGSADQIVPHFVMTVMGDTAIVPGILIAGILAATLSSVSTGLNTTASIIYKDVIGAINKGNRFFISTDSRDIVLVKLISVLVGLASFGCIFIAKGLPTILDAALTINGIIAGPLFGLFTLGIFVPFASRRGALTGLMTSLVFMLWLGYGQLWAQNVRTYGSTIDFMQSPKRPLSKDQCPASWLPEVTTTTTTSSTSSTTTSTTSAPEPPSGHLALYDVSYMWFTLIGFTIVLLLGTVVSCVYPEDIRRLDSQLVAKAVPGVVKSICPKFTGIGEKVEKYWDEVGSLRSDGTAPEVDGEKSQGARFVHVWGPENGGQEGVEI